MQIFGFIGTKKENGARENKDNGEKPRKKRLYTHLEVYNLFNVW